MGIATGAFGAHYLKGKVSDPILLETWKTASYYHLIHSAIFLYVSNLPKNRNLIGGLFLGGIILFSGSLYTLVLTEKKKLGMITPIGGLTLIVAWLSLAFL